MIATRKRAREKMGPEKQGSRLLRSSKEEKEKEKMLGVIEEKAFFAMGERERKRERGKDA